MAFNPGDTLDKGKYTIEEELGSGRFGTTYLARDRHGKQWAIKTQSDQVLRQLNSKQADRLKVKFWQEATKLAQCQHDHIVKAKEPFIERSVWMFLLKRIDRVCIPMEYIPGKKTLQDLPKPLPEAEALHYIQQIGEALICVHDRNLVHRDVKPSNIMLRGDSGDAVLIDFGLAREAGAPVSTVQPTTADGFAPPELYDRGAIPQPRADVYSLAATLYVLLTGEPPPKSVERYRVHLVPPQQKNPQISDRVNAAIVKGLEYDAALRPQTMREWLDELLEDAGNVPKPRSPLPDPDPPRPIEVEMRNLAILGIVVAIAIGILSAVPGWLDRMEEKETHTRTSLRLLS